MTESKEYMTEMYQVCCANLKLHEEAHIGCNSYCSIRLLHIESIIIAQDLLLDNMGLNDDEKETLRRI